MTTETETPEVAVTDDEIEMAACDECGCEMTQDEYDAEEGMCPKCTAKVMRVCKRCHGDYHVDDAHTEFPMCCDSCGDDEHTEIADDLWENQITDLVGSWSGEAYEIGNLRKLLAYARKLHKACGAGE